MSPAECHLRHRPKEAEDKVASLVVDASGGAYIARLEAALAALNGTVTERDALLVEVANLRSRAKGQAKENREQRREISRLKADLAYSYELSRNAESTLKKCKAARFEWAQKARALAIELKDAKAEIAGLEARLKRDSTNSSIPPSACTNAKKTVSNLRQKSGRRPGGQPGHAFHPRTPHPVNERVVLPAPCACPVCGKALLPTDNEKARQLTDIEIRIRTVEYVAQEHTCSSCGAPTSAQFPCGVDNEANYGNGLRAAVTYLTGACNVSIDNAVGFFAEATGGRLKLSKGSVHNFLKSFSAKAAGEVSAIAGEVASAPVIGTDATHVRASGKQAYIYTFNCDSAVLYTATPTKGKAPLVASPVDGHKGTMVHDHDVSYYSFGAAHAECNVHICRYLKGVCQNEPGAGWAKDMYELLLEANQKARAARACGAQALKDGDVDNIRGRYDEILDDADAWYAAGGPYNPRYMPDGIALSARLRKYRDNHLLFTRDLSVPFDNNASERLLRGAKKKLRQTGGFKSLENGQSAYCDLLSVVQTAKLKDMPVLGTVRSVFDGRQGLFVETAPGASP
jgi:hypothetical protein